MSIDKKSFIPNQCRNNFSHLQGNRFKKEEFDLIDLIGKEQNLLGNVSEKGIYDMLEDQTELIDIHKRENFTCIAGIHKSKKILHDMENLSERVTNSFTKPAYSLCLSNFLGVPPLLLQKHSTCNSLHTNNTLHST
ncbi:hypothetical protein BpHYR1_048129 [Brachionus plicatilis]|uniref:Uncharacterized protein n=1 Tax=Brachionus plicatilis TaxID=10195 RepID=A0A3M7RGN5_BRAPC|nr:hypothetical protein BpHYR1_048129 [Brachionus plicatilis]